METLNQVEEYDRVIFAGIDILNDFSPEGALPVAEGDKVVEPANTAARSGREKNGRVIWVKEAHKKVTKHFKKYGGPWPEHGVEGTWGAEFIDGLEALEEDVILKKGAGQDEDAYSGYFGVDNNGQMFENYVEPGPEERVALIIGGLATDYCVKATVLDARQQAERIAAANDGRKLGVFVLKDAIRAVNINPDDGQNAIAEMEAAGARFINSDELTAGRVITIRN